MSRCRERVYGAEFSREDIARTVREGGLLSMEIEFNSDCNFKCIYCYASSMSSSLNGGELTREEIKDVILQARDMGAQKIIILGGEPMLYPHLQDMIRFIKSLGMEAELFTNGVNVTPDMARFLYENGVMMVLKMNSFDEKTQDMLSGRKGAYAQIQNAFRNLREAGYPNGRSLGVSTVICRQNIDELPDLWQWLRDQAINPYFEMITPQGNAKQHTFLEVDVPRIQKFFATISEIDRKKYGLDWKPQPPLVGGQCLRHQFSCSVNSRGYVQPCVGVTIPVGNVREKKLKDIISESEVVNDLRNYRWNIKGPCRECARLDECYGCRGAAYQSTGDYLASDPLCWENAEKLDTITRLPFTVAGLVPHQPPMLMVNRVLEVGERVSVSEVNVSKANLFIGDDGKLDPAAYPEIISQASAAHEGFKNAGKRDYDAKGFLLGIKKLEILGAAEVGDTLRVSVRKVARYGEFGIIQGEVLKGEQLIARGELKLWRRDTHEN